VGVRAAVGEEIGITVLVGGTVVITGAIAGVSCVTFPHPEIRISMYMHRRICLIILSGILSLPTMKYTGETNLRFIHPSHTLNGIFFNPNS
jgi:hypothetical protein